MTKKTLLNVFIVILTYLIPVYFLRNHSDSAIWMGKYQVLLFSTLLIGSVLLTYTNWRREENSKLAHFVFKVLGILGLLYSGIILLLIFLFRKGIGF